MSRRYALKRNIGDEHQKIMDAVLGRDADKAVKLLAQHLGATTAIFAGCGSGGTAAAQAYRAGAAFPMRGKELAEQLLSPN